MLSFYVLRKHKHFEIRSFFFFWTLNLPLAKNLRNKNGLQDQQIYGWHKLVKFYEFLSRLESCKFYFIFRFMSFFVFLFFLLLVHIKYPKNGHNMKGTQKLFLVFWNDKKKENKSKNKNIKIRGIWTIGINEAYCHYSLYHHVQLEKHMLSVVVFLLRGIKLSERYRLLLRRLRMYFLGIFCMTIKQQR